MLHRRPATYWVRYESASVSTTSVALHTPHPAPHPGFGPGALRDEDAMSVLGAATQGSPAQAVLLCIGQAMPACVALNVQVASGAVAPCAACVLPQGSRPGVATVVLQAVPEVSVAQWRQARLPGLLQRLASGNRTTEAEAWAAFRALAGKGAVEGARNTFPSPPRDDGARPHASMSTASSAGASGLSHHSALPSLHLSRDMERPTFRLKSSAGPLRQEAVASPVPKAEGPRFAAAFPVDPHHHPLLGRAPHCQRPPAQQRQPDRVPIQDPLALRTGGVGTNFRVPLRERECGSSTAGDATGSTTDPTPGRGPASSASVSLGITGTGTLQGATVLGESALGHAVNGDDAPELEPVLEGLHASHGGIARS